MAEARSIENNYWINSIKKSINEKLPKNFRKLTGFVKIVESVHLYSGYCNYYFLKKKKSLNKY